MSFAYQTPVAVSPAQSKAIEQFQNGDTVYAAGADLNWGERKITVSDGIPLGSYANMITIGFELGGQSSELTVTFDQVFLMPDKKLKKAGELVPGDNLVSVDGAGVEVFSLTIGEFKGGIAGIATDAPLGVDGHLILVNGIVCGDLMLEFEER